MAKRDVICKEAIVKKMFITKSTLSTALGLPDFLNYAIEIKVAMLKNQLDFTCK